MAFRGYVSERSTVVGLDGKRQRVPQLHAISDAFTRSLFLLGLISGDENKDETASSIAFLERLAGKRPCMDILSGWRR